MAQVAEPRTQREIMAALHMPVPQRNCCNEMLDDGRNGFGARHLALVVVTFTFSVMCLSILRSGGATRSVQRSAADTAEGEGLPLHYVENEITSMLIYPSSTLKRSSFSLAAAEEVAKSSKASVIAFVGDHTADDTKKVLTHLEAGGAGPSSPVQYVMAVSQTEEVAQPHESLYADSRYFSVLSKRSGLEILSARRERVALDSSAIAARLKRTPFESLVLLTSSRVLKADASGIPPTTVKRIVFASEAKGAVVVSRMAKGASGGVTEEKSCAAVLLKVGKGKGVSFECIAS